MANYVGADRRVGPWERDDNGSVVSWGAVFSGALIGVAVMTLVTLLWYAIAVGGSTFMSDNLAWFVGGTAILSTFLAGLFSGWFAVNRGLGNGLVQGLTTWALITFAVAVGGPGVASLVRLLTVSTAPARASSWLWTAFWSVLIGLGAALAGSAIGGATVSPQGAIEAREQAGRPRG
ncbi:MAG TPA: hypothetical protein VI248_06205 [Kineosporiaceae bacterium]